MAGKAEKLGKKSGNCFVEKEAENSFGNDETRTAHINFRLFL